MFNKQHRFSFSGKFPSLTIQSPFFVMRYEKTDKPFVVAIVASKKIDKRSVVRNQAKRKLFHVLADVMPKESTLAVIFYVRKPLLAATPEDVKKELLRVLKQADGI